MPKIVLAAIAALVVTAASPLALAQSSNLKLAQQQSPGVQVAPGVQVGPSGVTVGQQRQQKKGCRTIRTTEEMADGRKTTKTERVCD